MSVCIRCVGSWRGNAESELSINVDFARSFQFVIHLSSGLMAASDAPESGLADTKGDTAISPPSNSETPLFPDPIASPHKFLEYLRSLSIPELLTSWDLLQSRPIREAATNRYVGASVTDWTEKMDTTIVSQLYFL